MVRPGHDPRQHLQNIFQGTLEGGRRPGLQRKYLMVSAKEWLPLPMPELFTTASCRKDWNRISAKSSPVSPLPPPLLDVPIGQGTKLS